MYNMHINKKVYAPVIKYKQLWFTMWSCGGEANKRQALKKITIRFFLETCTVRSAHLFKIILYPRNIVIHDPPF